MLAIMAGLVLGKPPGLVAASALAVQLGFAVERDEYFLRQLAGAGALAGIAFTMSLFIAVARRPRRPPISPPRGSPCLPPRCCPPSSTWPCRRIGAPAGDHGIVPGSAERAEERHLGFIQSLAASELRAPAIDGPACAGGDRNRCLTPNTVCIERSLYPIRKVTTPVPVEGGVAGGALAMSAGTSFQGRRKPKGSACQRRTMWPVQQAPQHRIRAMCR